MEAMGAGAKSGCIIPIKIVEVNILDVEVFLSRSDDSMGTHYIKDIVSIVRSTNDQGPVDLRILSDHFSCQREFNTCEDIVGNLHVIEVDISYSLSDGTVSVVFPTNKVIKIGSDWRILPVRVRWVSVIESERLTWVSPRNHVMEYSKTISAHRVSSIPCKLSDSIIFWANILVSGGTHRMSLKIIPEAVSIRASSMVSNKYIVGMGDPEASRCLISVQ